MISIDTSVLLYSLNADAPEHASARAFLQDCSARSDVAITELVLLELYSLLRDPSVVRHPLGAEEAVSACEPFRSHPRWALIENAPVTPRVWDVAADPDNPRRRVHDARIALTLLHHGVTEFATHDTEDFKDFGFDRVFDPINEASEA